MRRTDLAVEAKELWRESAGETTRLQGVRALERREGDLRIETVEILDERGEAALGKPVGTYITVDTGGAPYGELTAPVEAVRRELRELLPPGPLLVAGLGNEDVTPDSLGPRVLRHLLVTRHLTGESLFKGLGSVAAVAPGVLGTTGIETAELLKAAVRAVSPSAVIAVDALASRSIERVCSTVQLSNTGIVPGSGVGNSRARIDESVLGVPVIAVGVPTVVDADTLAADLLARAGAPVPEGLEGAGLMVTPREIDSRVETLSRVIGFAVSLAAQPEMQLPELRELLGE